MGKSEFDNQLTKMNRKAFPSAILKDENGNETVSLGMDLRDWFAGQALKILVNDSPGVLGDVPKVTAKKSYQIADAMMKQRESKQ